MDTGVIRIRSKTPLFVYDIRCCYRLFPSDGSLNYAKSSCRGHTFADFVEGKKPSSLTRPVLYVVVVKLTYAAAKRADIFLSNCPKLSKFQWLINRFPVTQ